MALWQSCINILDGSFKSQDFSTCPVLMKLFQTILIKCVFVMETCGIIKVVLFHDLNEEDKSGCSHIDILHCIDVLDCDTY